MRSTGPIDHIGYWRHDETQEQIDARQFHKAGNYENGELLPFPVANTVDNVAEQAEIVARLEYIMSVTNMPGYRGWSTCRLCGCHNGSKELHIEHKGVAYYIPEGYVHYLKAHSVKADSRLLHILP